MSRRVLLEPEASAEIRDAAQWYEAQRSGLGLAFLAAVDRVVEHVTAWPDAGTTVPGVSANFFVRRMPVSRFPYHVAYIVVSDAVRVIAIAHDHRRPGYWHPRTEP